MSLGPVQPACEGEPLSVERFNEWKTGFPNLKFCEVVKLADSTETYNCMGYTLNPDFNPNLPLEYDDDFPTDPINLDIYYRDRGVEAGRVAYYGHLPYNNTPGQVVHVALTSGGPGTLCSFRSKMGPKELIAHNQNGLDAPMHRFIRTNQ